MTQTFLRKPRCHVIIAESRELVLKRYKTGEARYSHISSEVAQASSITIAISKNPPKLGGIVSTSSGKLTKRSTLIVLTSSSLLSTD